MKKITQKIKTVAFILSMVIATSSFAHPGSSFSLILPNHTEHVVFINNNRYTNVYDRLNVQHLDAGRHQLKVVEIQTSHRGRIVSRRTVYAGQLFIPRNSSIVATIGHHGRLILREDSRSHRNYNNGRSSRGGRKGFRNGDSKGGKYGMDASDFNKHFQSIREEKFDNTRMAKAKDLVSDNPLTSSQIKELSNLFTFEASKLEFAKFAYTNCDDPENYPSVAEGFKYESSKKELEEYIAQNRVD